MKVLFFENTYNNEYIHSLGEGTYTLTEFDKDIEFDELIKILFSQSESIDLDVIDSSFIIHNNKPTLLNINKKIQYLFRNNRRKKLYKIIEIFNIATFFKIPNIFNIVIKNAIFIDYTGFKKLLLAESNNKYYYFEVYE